ncbi:ABC transporter substrate-binding protein [Candidatus Bipolaricaulota bacterium]
MAGAVSVVVEHLSRGGVVLYRKVAVLAVGFCLLSGWAFGRTLRVCLDFFPNPNHVPLYLAIVDGLFEARGLDVELIVPANPSDPVKLAAARTIDVALTPQINYLVARSAGLPLVAIGALIDRNLGGLLALGDSGIGEIGDLAGRRIGYSLAPLEPILWETMLRCAGVPIDEVELINVGYATVASLLAGSVDAIGAFRNFEPIQVELQGESSVFFPQEEHCIPLTYDIILVVNPDLVEERTGDLRLLLEALSEAIAFTQADPEGAFGRFVAANPDLGDELNRRSFAATVSLFASGLRHDDEAVWETLQGYLVEQELMAAALPMRELYTAALLDLNEEESQ